MGRRMRMIIRMVITLGKREECSAYLARRFLGIGRTLENGRQGF